MILIEEMQLYTLGKGRVIQIYTSQEYLFSKSYQARSNSKKINTSVSIFNLGNNAVHHEKLQKPFIEE